MLQAGRGPDDVQQQRIVDVGQDHLFVAVHRPLPVVLGSAHRPAQSRFQLDLFVAMNTTTVSHVFVFLNHRPDQTHLMNRPCPTR